MIILGLHYGHNGGACVVKDGKLVAALSTERLTGNLKCWGVDRQTIHAVLDTAGICLKDVHCFGLSDYSDEYNFDTIKVTMHGEPVHRYWTTVFDDEVHGMLAEMEGKKFPAFHISHHMAHCAAAYYTSPFDSAWCFSLDASGGKLKSNSLIAKGEGRRLTSVACPNLMVGVLYGFFTEFLGLGHQMLKAGSLMGLSAYGKILPHVRQNIEYLIRDCVITDTDTIGSERIENFWKLVTDKPHFSPEDKDSDAARDIAASIQFIFEKVIERAMQLIPAGVNLCLGGGSMLNCVANSMILDSGRFKNVHLFPACTDDGGPIGTALYLAHNVFNDPRHKYTDAETCYLGPERKQTEDVEYPKLALELASGKTVAWVSGRAEFGPRALGNRSIFADPRRLNMRDHINLTVKKREWFRPFAPIVMEEHVHEWFEFDARKSPFMLFTAKAKRPELIPAVVHVDGSARIQTVTEESNPLAYELLNEFYKITDVPMLLNTSMNRSGKPMVETPSQIEDFWEHVPVDIMVVDGVKRYR